MNETSTLLSTARAFLWNILLALAWAAVTGNFSLPSLLVGFAVGFVILTLVRRVVGSPQYLTTVGKLVRFVAFFLWALVAANLRVAFDVITPRHRMRPGVLAIPLDAKTDSEIMLLANLITLTPGTLALDVSEDHKYLYVHAMYLDDADAVTREIKDGLERRLLELMR